MSGTYTWNGGDGDWYSDNWDAPGSDTPGAAPPSGASVFIGNASTVTLAVGDPNPGGSVFIDDGTLTVYATGIALATLTLAGIDTGAEINGSGTVDVTDFYMGAQYLNGVVSSGYIGGSLTVVLTGLGNIGGTLGIDQIGDSSGGTAELNIASGALLTIEDSAGLGADANGILVNDGTLEKLAASGTVQGTSLITSQFTNVGTIQVDAGVLQLGGSTITLGGAVDGAGVLDLVGTTTLESNLVLLAGGVTLETSGTTTLDQVAAAIPAGDVFEQTGGTLTANTLLPSGTADLVVDGEAVLSAGELVDTSATYPASPDLLIASTGTLAITGYTSYGTYTGGYVFGSGYLENEGQATIGADQDGNTYSALQYAYSTPAVYANQGTTTLLDSNITSVLGAVGPGYNGGFFYNYGTLININDQTADINATQTNTIQVYSFDNYGGTVDVQSGDLEINIAGGAFQGGSFSGAGMLGLGGGLGNANISIEFGATSTVATLEFDPYGNGLYDIGQDFTQSGALDIGNGGGEATLHLDTDYLSPPTPAATTLTVTGATNMTDGVLEVGTLVAEGGIDMPIYEDFFQVSGSTLENAGSGTLLGELELSQGTLSLNSGVGGTLVNDQGAVISLSGTLEGDYDRYASITADDTSEEIANNGTLVGDGPSGYGSGPLYAGNFPGPYISASIANDGLIEVQQGALLLDGVDGDAITGTGSIQIDANAAVEIDTQVSGNSVVFSGTGALLQIDDLSNTDSGPLVQDFNAPISGFAAGDTIDFFNIAYAGASIDVAPDNSSVSIYSDNTYEGTLDFDPPAGTFQLTDLGGVAALTLSPAPCYCPGTLILTDRGEMPIEDLRIGDTVMTASGQSRPIRWIGRRSYAGAFITGRRDILPVRISRGALAEGVPHRDLWVSPMHAMYLEGYLIPAVALVNGISIVQAEAVEHVAYVNLELPSHDVILAEGAAAETFIDDESRYQFQNAAEYETLYPRATRSPPVYYAPRLEEGDRLHAICAAIAARAAGVAHPSCGPLEGRLDLVSSELIEGWARDLGNPDAPVRLRILDNKQVLCEVLANRFRPDLKEAGIGDGCHAFSVTVPGGLTPQRRHLIEVQRAADGQTLPNAPLVLEARPACPVVACEKPATWQGQLETVTRERIEGWAWDSAQPASPMRLQVLVDGDVVASVVANRFRQDLAQAGIGDGRHAFSLVIPGGLSSLSRHVIRVLCEADGMDMPNSPFLLEPATAFDAALEHAVESAVTALATPCGVTEAQGRVLDFLAAQTERVLQLRAESESGPHLRLVQRQLRRDAVRDLPASANARRALVVTTDFSRPGCDAHISKLQQMGYEICLVAAANLTPDADTVARLEQADITVCRTPFYASVEEVFRRQATCLDLITLDGPAIAACYAALARSHAPRVRIMCSTGDVAALATLCA